VASEDPFSAGVRGWAQATFLPHSRVEAISAPARNVASLAHTTSSVTHRGHHRIYALRNNLGMFDDVALRIDYAGD